MKILIAAGGSGGHLLPAQQLAEALKSDAEIFFAGHRLDASPFFERGRFSFRSIDSAPFKLSPFGFLIFAGKSLWGTFQSLYLLLKFKPDIVVGFGSFHVFPILLAAALLRQKIALFEANCQLGKVNRLFAPFAKIVAAQFDLRNKPRNLRFVPLLPWKDGRTLLLKKEARKKIGLFPDRKTMLVFGGSQGAAFLNRTIPALLPLSLQVIHLTGKEGLVHRIQKDYKRRGIHAVVKPFEINMLQAYAAADFAICRSGAGTIAELIQMALPALLIPFPFAADDHQRINAEFLVKKVRGAKMLLEPATSELISQQIENLLREEHDLRSNLLSAMEKAQGRTSFREQIIDGLKRSITPP